MDEDDIIEVYEAEFVPKLSQLKKKTTLSSK